MHGSTEFIPRNPKGNAELINLIVEVIDLIFEYQDL